MQGALRSAFLVRVGLTKEAFIGTGVVVAFGLSVETIGTRFGGIPSGLPAFTVPQFRFDIAQQTFMALGCLRAGLRDEAKRAPLLEGCSALGD